MSDEATPPSCATSVAVGTHNLALRDLCEHRLPLARAENHTHADTLLGDVVEIEDHRVRFATVPARVLRELVDEPQRSLES